MGGFRVALAQINAVVGDTARNTEEIVAKIKKGRALGVDLIVFPELAVTGYPPEDLLYKPDFIAKNEAAIKTIARETKGIAAIVGFVDRKTDIFNAAAVIDDGEIKAIYRKRSLPNYGVFDEERYFTAGDRNLALSIGGFKLGVLICEDLWNGALDSTLCALDALIVINASPFSASKNAARSDLLSSRARDLRSFILYVNLVGAQDELVFDGASAIYDPRGNRAALAKIFEEDMLVCDLDLEDSFRVRLKDGRVRAMRRGALSETNEVELNAVNRQKPPLTPRSTQPLEQDAAIYAALKIALKDYARKNGFTKAVLGISGGVDSALVAAIAADALGCDNILGVLMPSPYSSAQSVADALELAKNLNVQTETIAIDALMFAFENALKPQFEGKARDLTEENLQARIRGTLLMALSNKFGYLVLSTGNKSELSVGYSTLYGDLCGGFAPIKDVLKTKVYDLCRYRNSISAAIPQNVLTKPPSAELRENQKDSDELPDYELLDELIRLYIEEDFSLSEIDAKGYDPQITRKVVALVQRNEYKRSQAPVGAKISDRAFGRDRRMPISNGYDELI
ncbi:MAG: NAD+ synthase [Helicobacteraceae bacterium]|jgi:NAD+ synthase (glutamine-hydrolysing)|nr:NAD+ synthase [Helicobacteraceae bacterium]